MVFARLFFPSVRTVAVTDGDFIFTGIDFFDACHRISFLSVHTHALAVAVVTQLLTMS